MKAVIWPPRLCNPSYEPEQNVCGQDEIERFERQQNRKRLRNRWIDRVKSNPKMSEIINCKELANDREARRGVVFTAVDPVYIKS